MTTTAHLTAFPAATLPGARTAFVPLNARGDLYAITVRRGSTSATIGRVSRYGTGRFALWAALGIGAAAWTDYYRTREAAVDAMREGRVFRR